MGMQFTFTNIFQFISGISPLLIGFFLVMMSIFNQNLKGIIYLSGVLIASVINLLIMNMIKSPAFPDRSPACDIVDMPFGMSVYNSPALSSMFIAFTIAYLGLPMKYNGTANYPVLASLLALFVMDAISKVSNKCTTSIGTFVGGLFGLLFGCGWYALFRATGNNSLLYFDEVDSNNIICNRPSKQQFKCSVYKNGELIKQL